MTALSAVTSIITDSISQLKPMERWEAAGRFDGNWLTERWFILTVIFALMILTVLLAASVVYRKIRERKASEIILLGRARKKGLSESELQILLEVANSSPVSDKSSVMVVEQTFNEGAGILLERAAKRKSTEEVKLLRGLLMSLKKNLGFVDSQANGTEKEADKGIGNTLQIPVGTKVYITRRMWRFDDGIETTVIENNERGLKIEVGKKVKVIFGDKWRASCAYGRTVWGFDTSVVESVRTTMLLSHSDDVYFLNRRRFSGQQVRQRGSVCRLPFIEMVGRPDVDGVEQKAQRASDIGPVFFPAVVTEIAGPWLKVELTEQISAGEKVLATFLLDKEEEDEGKKAKVVKDFGIVRRSEAITNGYLLAVELKGCNDSQIEQLLSAVSQISSSSEGHQTEDGPKSGKEVLAANTREGA